MGKRIKLVNFGAFLTAVRIGFYRHVYSGLFIRISWANPERTQIKMELCNPNSLAEMIQTIRRKQDNRYLAWWEGITGHEEVLMALGALGITYPYGISVPKWKVLIVDV